MRANGYASYEGDDSGNAGPLPSIRMALSGLGNCEQNMREETIVSEKFICPTPRGRSKILKRKKALILDKLGNYWAGPDYLTQGVWSRKLYRTDIGRVKISGLFGYFNLYVKNRVLHISFQKRKNAGPEI